MIEYNIKSKTSITRNESYEGETLETKVQRMVRNGEPLDKSVPLYYTERKEGVRPEFNIRTDKFDLALDAMEIAQKGYLAKRENRHNPKENDESTDTNSEI